MTATEVLSLGLDIGIQDGKIRCIGQGLEVGPETHVVDAEGAYITPGYVILIPKVVILDRVTQG